MLQLFFGCCGLTQHGLRVAVSATNIHASMFTTIHVLVLLTQHWAENCQLCKSHKLSYQVFGGRPQWKQTLTCKYSWTLSGFLLRFFSQHSQVFCPIEISGLPSFGSRHQFSLLSHPDVHCFVVIKQIHKPWIQWATCHRHLGEDTGAHNSIMVLLPLNKNKKSVWKKVVS